MNSMHLMKIALCFILLEITMGFNLLMAEPCNQSLSEAKLTYKPYQKNRGPRVKVDTIQGKSLKKIQKIEITDEEIQRKEKEIRDFLRTKGMPEEEIESISMYLNGKVSAEELIAREKRTFPGKAFPIDEGRIKESLLMEGRSDQEAEYIIKTFFRGEPDLDEGKQLSKSQKAETDRHLHGIWEKMRTALSNNDIETAVSCFTEKNQKHYRWFFKSLSDENCNEVAEALKDLQLIQFHSSRYAEYDVQETRDGMQVSWLVIFIKLPRENDWKIKSF